MKRLLGLFFVIIIIYVVYFDLTHGTLPANAPETIQTWDGETEVTSVSVNESITYKIRRVQPGDTVLSIVEQLHQGSLPVSIETVIDDFEALNNNEKVTSLNIGKSYKFPYYQTDHESAN